MKTLTTIKNALLALLGILFLLFNPAHAKAWGVWGADISWTCIGDSSFTITLSAYHDCYSSYIAGASFYLVPMSGNGGNCSSGTITASNSMTNGKDITPICNKSCDQCTNSSCSFPYGVQQWEETIIIHFPANACCKYEIQWGACCRGSLTTIQFGYFYLNAIMNRCDTPCDASPRFTNPPIAIVTAGQCYMLNQGATDNNVDKNGNPDSLAYKLVEPLVSEGQPVQWNPPYNYKEPLDYDGAFGNPNGTWNPAKNICDGFHLDSFTGELYFKPMKTDVTDMAIRVQVWKKDAYGVPYLSSEITRDAEVVVLKDSPVTNIPTLSGINGTNTTRIDYCVGVEQCFNVNTNDIITTDTVTLSWNSAITGATFTTNNKKVNHAAGTFCWKPTQARSHPYYFVVDAQDNFCPLTGRASNAYAIYVHPTPAATYSSTAGRCGEVSFKAHPVPGSAVSSYLWTGAGSPPLYSTSDSFTHKYRLAGKYPYSLTITGPFGCGPTYYDTVIINPYVEALLPTEDTFVCQNTLMHIRAKTMYGIPPYSYKWNCSASTADSISEIFAKDTLVVVTISDSTGCTNYDSMKVHVVVPPSQVLNTYACAGSAITLNDENIAPATHVWQKETSPGTWVILSANTNTPFQTVNDSGQYRAVINDSGVANCTGTVYVHAHYNPLLQLEPDSTFLCAGYSITLFAAPDSTAGDSAYTTWEWYDLTHRVWAPYYTRTITVNKSIDYEAYGIENENGISCEDSSEIKVTELSSPKIIFKAMPPQCTNGAPINLDSFVTPLGTAHSWSMETKKKNELYNDTFNPAISGAGKFYVKYKVENQIGCISTDSIKIQVYTPPTVSAEKNDTTYLTSSKYLLNGYPNGGKWTSGSSNAVIDESPSGSGIYYFYPSQSNVGIYWLKYTYSAPKGGNCTGTDSTLMYLLPYKGYQIISCLFADIDTNCTVLFTDESKIFKVVNNPICGQINQWYWSFGDSATSTLQNPSHQYKAGGVYMVKLAVSSTGGCTDTFTKSIYIDSACGPTLQAGFYITGTKCIDSMVTFHDSSVSTAFCGPIKQWQWDFGDGATDTIENPSHEYAYTGAYNVSLSTASKNCKSTLSRIVSIDSCNLTGIAPFSLYSNINIYPNPVNNSLNIDMGTNLLNSIMIYDAMGRVVYSNSQVQNFVKAFELPTSALPAGVYILRLGIGEGYYMARFMKE